MSVALIVGTLLAVGALAFVLYPLFADAAPAPRPRPAPTPEDDELDPRNQAIAALREVEFDRATGKLSDADYTKLKADYTREALAALRAEPAIGTAVAAEDPTEALIASYRAPRLACPTCGPRPERDAVFCSACGRYLPAACPACRAPITEPGARFCNQCGSGLAA